MLRLPFESKVICEHHMLEAKGEISKLEQEPVDSTNRLRLWKVFEVSAVFQNFMYKVKEQLSRYITRQSRALYQASTYYSKEELLLAFKHCLEVNVCNFSEVMAYLVSKLGNSVAKSFISKNKMSVINMRAKEIEEVQYGK